MLVDSKNKQLSQEAILMIAAQETKSPHPASTLYAAMIKEMNMPGTSIVRDGNTVFIIHNAQGRVGVFRALNHTPSFRVRTRWVLIRWSVILKTRPL